MELELFQALQKQEQLAASHRLDSIWKEVQMQKELEQTLQRRYGDLVPELEKMQQAQKEEEMRPRIMLWSCLRLQKIRLLCRA